MRFQWCVFRNRQCDTVRNTETLSEFHFSRELFIISIHIWSKLYRDFCKVTNRIIHGIFITYWDSVQRIKPLIPVVFFSLVKNELSSESSGSRRMRIIIISLLESQYRAFYNSLKKETKVLRTCVTGRKTEAVESDSVSTIPRPRM